MERLRQIRLTTSQGLRWLSSCCRRCCLRCCPSLECGRDPAGVTRVRHVQVIIVTACVVAVAFNDVTFGIPCCGFQFFLNLQILLLCAHMAGSLHTAAAAVSGTDAAFAVKLS